MMNYRIFAISALLLFAAHLSLAQASLTGIIRDKDDKNALPGATVLLENVNDRSEKAASTTDTAGFFKIENLHQGDYYVKITYVGYEMHDIYVTVKNGAADLGVIYLTPESRKLNEVTVEGALPRVELKGDTSVFNAKAYKTMPDATTEDLVRKMPGIMVVDGKVQAEGEDVKQVLVDGRPFFGEDPNIALKNLPAEIVEKVQVYDEGSEQSRFTGFDDGETKKTMNIVTFPNMRNSQFGKIYGGYGYEDNDEYDDKYSFGGNVNLFNGDQRISVLAQSNNINNQNFSIEDIVGAVSGGGNRMRMGPPPGGGSRRPSNDDGFRPPGFSSVDNFLVQDQGGISSTNALGINYSDAWGKKLNVTGSYFYNKSDNISEETVNQEYKLLTDSSYVYREDQTGNSKNLNHRFNLKLDYDINDYNSLLIKPKFTFQDNKSNSILTGGSYQNDMLLNSTNRDYQSSLSGYNFSNQLLFRHKFNKPGRTISLDLNVAKNEKTGDSKLLSVSSSYFENEQDSVNQVSDVNVDGYSLSSDIAYTEPLSSKSMIQVNYQTFFEKDQSEKNTFNYDAELDEYSRRDTTLSNVFESKNIVHRLGTGYRLRTERSNFSVGADYQVSNLRSNSLFPETSDEEYTFTNILPNAMFRTRFSEKSDLMMMYRTSTSNPSVTQLQNVIDNSNSLQLTIGNPELEQQYHHRIMMHFRNIDRQNSKMLFAALGGGVTGNYISNSTFIARRDTLLADNVNLPAGGQLIKPVNLGNSWNIHSFGTYGMPVKFLSSNLNVNLSMNYSHTPAMVNDITSYTNNTTLGAGLVLSSNIDETIDFTISGNNSFSNAKNSHQESLNDRYYNFSGRADLSWLLLKKIIFRSEWSYENYQGLSSDYNEQYMLWNLSLGTKFMEENRGEISLKVYDLLNQNNSIQRNVTSTYIEDVQTKVLQRYFMISFTYNLRNFKNNKEIKN